MLTSNGYRLDESTDRLGPLEPVPDDERGSRERLRARLDEHGYLYLRGQIDPSVVTDFRAHYFGRLAATGLVRTDRPAVDGIAAPADRLDRAALRHTLFSEIVPGPAYAALCGTPQVRDWFAWFLGGDVHLHRRKIIRHTRPDEHRDARTQGVGAATQAHYDLVYLRQGSDHVLSMWIPLGDCPRTLGGLVYLEGSHHRVRAEEAAGTRRPAASMTADLPALADRFDSRWLWADYAVGDVVVHTAHTVHAALDNVDRDGRLRLSTDIRYQRADEPIDQRWQHDWHDRDGL
ncbi:hypothetical protein FHX74_002386 [Friedmanniella endophytica]|uniref:Ectoine hydroxylase-related dioxygenase, phytanoyl-CoA dioxygenase (PhyH) family n=1 Tax=Microlunatus kandeliicorticis TaxID=1759536 RepID=A0A7W3IT37_9ACTN|nr:phytanoyl-CoA dioxygenase family protein [Microlunatus kandeliicorticis]MBA8794767.1 hypothetical protein [Microlunatus kandeliicorticis]